MLPFRLCFSSFIQITGTKFIGSIFMTSLLSLFKLSFGQCSHFKFWPSGTFHVGLHVPHNNNPLLLPTPFPKDFLKANGINTVSYWYLQMPNPWTWRADCTYPQKIFRRIFFFFFGPRCGMQDLRSPTRNQTHVSCSGGTECLTTRLPGKSSRRIPFIKNIYHLF